MPYILYPRFHVQLDALALPYAWDIPGTTGAAAGNLLVKPWVENLLRQFSQRQGALDGGESVDWLALLDLAHHHPDLLARVRMGEDPVEVLRRWP